VNGVMEWVRVVGARVAEMLGSSSSSPWWKAAEVLGLLAALLLGYYSLRRPPGVAGERAGQSTANPQDGNRIRPGAIRRGPGSVAAQNVPELVRTKMRGIRRITITVPEVLLDTTSDSQLFPWVGRLLRHLAALADVYLITQCVEDNSACEETVQRALQAEKLLYNVKDAAGTQSDENACIASHKVLYCSSSIGLTAIVRQLEPDLHIDASESRVQGLSQFVPRMLLISQNSKMDTSPNVSICSSVEKFFE